jgi:hypothetical protein
LFGSILSQVVEAIKQLYTAALRQLREIKSCYSQGSSSSATYVPKDFTRFGVNQLKERQEVRKEYLSVGEFYLIANVMLYTIFLADLRGVVSVEDGLKS